MYAIQKSVKEGRDRFLFEMATGTSMTLVSAVIKLFLRTGNARQVLFLVDQLELESQAKKAFVSYLKNDYQTAVYKESRDDWRREEIVISTIQSFMVKNRYKRMFAPDDFDPLPPNPFFDLGEGGRIEGERLLVEGNRGLIRIYEGKIR